MSYTSEGSYEPKYTKPKRPDLVRKMSTSWNPSWRHGRCSGNKRRQYQNELRRQQRKDNRAFIKAYKTNVPCMDCKQGFSPCCMDFDHRDPSLKTSIVSKMVVYGRNRLKREIAKCDIVCANCHRIRTHKRRQYGNYSKFPNEPHPQIDFIFDQYLV